MARTSTKASAGRKVNSVINAPEVVHNNEAIPDPNLQQVFTATDSTSVEDLLRYASLPGVRIEFDTAHFMEVSADTLSLLPADAVAAYGKAKDKIDEIDKIARRAVYEAPVAVDPMTKLLDGPHGMSNPLVRDADTVQKLLPDYYVTWRVQGGQGDIEAAKRAGFKIIRRPKDDTEAHDLSPLEWSGEIWRVRDGTVDTTSGDEIYNVMVVIRKGAWKDNLDAMSMVSHNAYSTNKKQFIEGIDNISRDMLSSKERIEVADLDEMHVEEHTVIQGNKRVRADSSE